MHFDSIFDLIHDYPLTIGKLPFFLARASYIHKKSTKLNHKRQLQCWFTVKPVKNKE